MATRTCKIIGKLPTDSASITVLFDGTQVFNGAVDTTGWEFPSNDEGVLCSFNVESDASEITDHTLSISVTSGMIEAGPLYWDTGSLSADAFAAGANVNESANDPAIGLDAGMWIPNTWSPYGDGSDSALAERSNILINGAAPAYPTSGTLPTGTEANPTWAGWQFAMPAGDTLTCTARMPGQWTPSVPDAPTWGQSGETPHPDVEVIDATSVLLHWTEVSDNGAIVTQVTITPNPATTAAVIVPRYSESGQDLSNGLKYTFGGLTTGTAYTFTITATNVVGTSASSLPSNSATPAA